MHIVTKTLTAVLLLVVATLALAGGELFDEKLAKDAVAVLRVNKVGRDWSVPKHPFVRHDVHVHQVFKNESRENLNHDFQVYAFKGMDGIPRGECTIYIARYDVANKRFDKTNGTIWMLVGGSATNGVSHVDSAAGFP